MIRLLKTSKLLLVCGVAGLLLAPTPAFAHDNLGGDELAVANWMLVGAMLTILMGVLAGVWAARSGQFSNIEESKFTMLDTAEDYDAIMAEAARREAVAGSTSVTASLKPESRDHARAEEAHHAIP